MSSTEQSRARTRNFARVLGPYLVIVTAVAVARASDMQPLISEFNVNSGFPWVTGAFVLLSGLVVIALHQYWRDAAAVIVSVLGWLTALKGLFLLAFPGAYFSVADAWVDADVWWRAAFVVVGLIGLYLTYVGWAPAPSRPKARASSSRPDIPRAA